MKTTCEKCNGTGKDLAHKWPDGTPAACESCDGYGFTDSEAGGGGAEQAGDENRERQKGEDSNTPVTQMHGADGAAPKQKT